MARPAAGTAAAVADGISSWLTRYREEPSLFLLLIVTGQLSGAEDPMAAAGAAGISGDWLREQGELTARANLQAVRDAYGMTVQELRKLRRALTRLGVPCTGWAVSDEEIDDALLRYAQWLYQQAVSRMSPYNGWELLQLAAGGWVPGLGHVAPGALAVATGYAVRHVQEDLADEYGDPATTLRQLSAMLPALDASVGAAFRSAGIPADEKGLEHAAEVIDVRRLWEQYRRGEEDDGLVLALACAPLLADGTVRPGEIGTTPEDVWAAARSWVAGQARLIADGDHDAVRRLSSFTMYSRLGYEPFGISDGQVAGWEQARARDRWARARAGDGQAAFEVILYCEDKGSYEQATGMPRGKARAELQAVMNSYAAGLRRQVETAAARKWAKPPFRELRDFASRVRQINDYFTEHDGHPLVDAPWDMPQAGWHDFHVRYVREEKEKRGQR